MKKISTLLMSFLCAWGLQAQTLKFQYEGKDIENGATVYSSTVDETKLHMGDGWMPSLNCLQFTPELTITSSVDAQNVHISVEVFQDDPGDGVDLCSFDGSCVNGSNPSKTGALSANVAESLQLHSPELRPADNYENVTIRAIVSAWYDGQEANKVSFTLVMSNDETVLGVGAVKSGAAYVRMSGGNVLRYALASEAAATLRVYGLDGTVCKSVALSEAEGSVSLASLRKGVYLYQIVAGSSKSTGKILVK